jgi:hypothetical protein
MKIKHLSYKCEFCGYEHEANKEEKIQYVKQRFLVDCGYGFVFVIATAALLLLFPFQTIKTVGVVSTLWDWPLTIASRQENDYSREVMINLSRDCEHPYCQVSEAFTHFSNFTYMMTPYQNIMIQDPEFTLKNKVGDCKSLSIAFCSMLNNAGFNCKVESNDCHAWSVVEPNTYLKDRLYVDVTQHIMTSNSQEFYNRMNNVCEKAGVRN